MSIRVSQKNCFKQQIYEMLGVEEQEPFHLESRVDHQIDTALSFRIGRTLEVEQQEYGGISWNPSPFVRLTDILLGTYKIVKHRQVALSDDDKILIRYAHLCGCKYLAVNDNGRVYGFKKPPYRRNKRWDSLPVGIQLYHGLTFLSWEDEPCHVELLMKQIKEEENE